MRRTQAEAAETRTALLDAALEVFADRGYTATRLDEVASRAGVTRGALYHHFRDKAELYITTLAVHWKEIAGPIWVQLDRDTSPMERLRRFAVAYLTSTEHNDRFRQLQEVTLFRAEALPELRAGMAAKRQTMADWADRLTAVLTEARERGELRPGRSPREAALAVLGLLVGTTSTWLANPDLFPLAASASWLIDTLLAGIAA